VVAFVPIALSTCFGADSFCRNCVARIFKCDSWGGDYTDIAGKYINDWNGRESTKRMEK
jgi:hypothetical protein